MRLQDLISMYGSELDDVAQLNGLEGRKEAVDALRHEIYARKNLFGYRPFYKLPESFDLDDFEKSLNRVFVP